MTLFYTLTCLSCHHRRDDAPSSLPRKCPYCGDLMVVDHTRRQLLQGGGVEQEARV